MNKTLPNECLLVADVAGRYEELMRLVERAPGLPVVLLGDLMDRGPETPKVIEWTMANAFESLKGNHEDMMISGCTDGKWLDSWIYNGGAQTLLSYGCATGEEAKAKVPTAHIEWLKARPVTIQNEHFFCSHAPWSDYRPLEEPSTMDYMQVLWNRHAPSKVREKHMFFGHNSVFKSKPHYTCLDDSANSILRGAILRGNAVELVQVPYRKLGRVEEAQV